MVTGQRVRKRASRIKKKKLRRKWPEGAKKKGHVGYVGRLANIFPVHQKE